MKRCRECKEVAQSGFVCLACGGKLYEMLPEEQEAFDTKKKEEKLLKQKKVERHRKLEKSVCLVMVLLYLVEIVLAIVFRKFDWVSLIGTVILTMGILAVLYPESMWEFNHIFSKVFYDEITPSDLGIKMIKIGGYFLMVLSILMAGLILITA